MGRRYRNIKGSRRKCNTRRNQGTRHPGNKCPWCTGNLTYKNVKQIEKARVDLPNSRCLTREEREK